ncbi:hypothetical protein MMC25_004769 [Agyrium rufum]|nr:hypothetical protein [Agyrium rufum]
MASLQLHVFGPAYSLPSIDPSCLAAIAYMTQAVPKGSWILIANCELGLKLGKDLPILRDGSLTVSGYSAIVSYLRDLSPSYDLDRNLSALREADLFAYTTHITHHLRPLLLISHFVSSENYNETTHPALLPLIPVTQRWHLPLHIRNAAHAATAHLGLSNLDISSTEQTSSPSSITEQNPTLPRQTDSIPVSLRPSIRQTLASALRQPQQANSFKIAALVERAFEPLEELLAETRNSRQSQASTRDGPANSWFLNTQNMTSLDCLALAYLSLSLIPTMPQAFLADALRKDYPLLCGFVDRGIKRCFGAEPIHTEDALLHVTPSPSPSSLGTDDEDDEEDAGFEDYENMDVGAEKRVLPWRAPERATSVEMLGVVAGQVIRAVPGMEKLARSNIPGMSDLATEEKGLTAATAGYFVLGAIGAVAAGVVALLYPETLGVAGWDIPGFAGGKRDGRRGLADMGEAGAMLSVFGVDERDLGASRRERHVDHITTEDGVPVMEVDVEIER